MFDQTVFPSQSHPILNDVRDQLERLKASQAASTSSVCANLASLKDLHEGINNNLIQIPSVGHMLVCEQGENWVNELIKASLRIVDLCNVSLDAVRLTKESIQDLESSTRRQTDDVDAYVATRKKVVKLVRKCIKNSKIPNKTSTSIPAIGTILRETETLDSSILNSLLVLLSGQRESSNKKSWPILLSKFTQGTSRVQSEVEQESCHDDLCLLSIHKLRKITIESIRNEHPRNRRVLGSLI